MLPRLDYMARARQSTWARLPQQFKENITGWVGLDQAVDPALVATPAVITRSAALATGVEFSAAFHPSWQPLLPKAIERIRDHRRQLAGDPTDLADHAPIRRCTN